LEGIECQHAEDRLYEEQAKKRQLAASSCLHILTCDGGIKPYPGAYTGLGCAVEFATGTPRAPPGFVICRSRAKPLKVPFTMSVTMETAKLRL
jgi:hypothetical protein